MTIGVRFALAGSLSDGHGVTNVRSRVGRKLGLV